MKRPRMVLTPDEAQQVRELVAGVLDTSYQAQATAKPDPAREARARRAYEAFEYWVTSATRPQADGADAEEVSLPFRLVERMEKAREAATIAALSGRVDIDDAAIHALAVKHGLTVDEIKEQTAYQLMQDLVFPLWTTGYREEMRKTFVLIARFVADYMEEQKAEAEKARREAG